jgi:hypothetical protein
MKKSLRMAGILLISGSLSVTAYGMTVYDPVNAMYNQVRNALLTLYHTEDIQNALSQLIELQKTFNELKRFHDGIDEIRSIFMGDYKTLLYRLGLGSWSGMGYELSGIQSDFLSLLNGSSSGGNLRSHMETIFGADPQSVTKPYITQEELFAADGFRWASEIRRMVENTVDAGEEISRAAATASPKGAARLSVDALGKILVTQAQIQNNQSKLIENGAAQIEQIVREDKYLERERMRFMQEFDELLDSLPGR